MSGSSSDGTEVPPYQALSLDGYSMSIDKANKKALAEKDPRTIALQIEELKRKIERQDAELKKAGKEARSFQKDILTLNNRLKEAHTEINGLRGEKEALNNALKVANAKVLDEKPYETQARLDANRIRELEDTVLMTKHKYIKLEETIEREKVRNSELKADLETAESERGSYKTELDVLKLECEEFPAKIEEFQIRDAHKDEQISTLKSDVSKGEERERELQNKISELKDMIEQANQRIQTVEEDFMNYKDALEKKNKALVKNKDSEVFENEVIIKESELKRLKKIEVDYRSAHARVQSLVESLDTHMTLLKQTEEENVRLAKSEKYLSTRVAQQDREAAIHKAEKTRHDGEMKRQKAIVSKLQSQLSDAYQHIEEVKGEGNSEQVSKMRMGMAALARTKQEEIEGKISERKMRQSAEEANKAMKNRLNFLLEQMGQASALASSWQEQKSILKAEIATLYKANVDLRQRLMGVQRSYLEKHMTAHLQMGMAGAPEYLAVTADDDTITDLDAEQYRLLPNSTEAIVERALFDAVCAFTSGIRVADGQAASERKGRKTQGLKGKFCVNSLNDGTIDIYFDDNSSVAQAETAELMNQMQIPIFLRFVQSRHEDRMPKLFGEKIASMLNHIRKMSADMAEQVAEARMQSAKEATRSENAITRSEKMRKKLIEERLAKQKSTLKVVREQIRWSDTCIILDRVTDRAEKELEYQASQYNLTKKDAEMKLLLSDVLACAEAATACSSSSSPSNCPVGALEIRVPESTVDDETLHGIFSLLSGSIIEKQENETRKLENDGFTPYLDRLLLLNLRDNCLTDLSCNVLVPLLEKSSNLRMLDLRGNKISSSGAAVLLEALNKNPTVMYVTQRQGGFMLEGHREIPTDEGDHVANRSQPKLPALRVDIRMNSRGDDEAEDMLLTAPPLSGAFVGKGALPKAKIPVTYNVAAFREQEGNLFNITNVTPQGLIQTDKLNLNNNRSRRPHSASAAKSSTYDMTLSANDGRRDQTHTLDEFIPGSFHDELGSPTNRFGPSSRKATRINSSPSDQTGSLLDTHIRKLQEDQASGRANTSSRSRSAGQNKSRNALLKGNSGKQAKGKLQRPYSAGNIRPGTASSSGLRAVKNPKSPAESMFLGKQKTSAVLEVGPAVREKVIPAGFLQSPTVTLERTAQQSSAFTLLDSLHNINGDRLF